MENVKEIVLFEIKDEALESFKMINTETMKQISVFDGYISSSSYQSANKNNLFLDIVEWDSLEKAKAAASAVENDKKFEPLLNSISKIHFFDHLHPIENSTLFYKEKNKNDILEFALFYLKDNSLKDYQNNRIPFMNHLAKNYQEFKQVSTLKGTSDKNMLLDIAFWEKIDVCHIAQKELESHQLFIEAFKNMDMEKQPIMEFFKKIR